MQDLDNHSDDLFRRAAENYSPAPGKSDWEKINSQISGSNTASSDKKEDRRRRLALLFFLFLVISGAAFFLNKYTGNSTENTATISSKQNNETKAGNSNEKNIAVANATAPILNNKTINTDNNTMPVIIASALPTDINLLNAGKQYRTKGKTTAQTTAAGVEEITEPAETASRKNDIATEGTVQENIEKKNSEAAIPEIFSGEPIAKKAADASWEENIAATKPEKEKENSTDKKTAVAEKKKNKEKGFYYGLTGGIEFGGVKQVYFNRAGFEAGVLAGYQFSNKLAVEASLLYNKKTYACNGKNFDIANTGMPANTQLMSLTGLCNSIEIPLHLVYNISNSKKSIVSISAGFSSFYSSGETNVYNTLDNGTSKKITSTYSNRSFYFASSADITIGFEKKLKNGNGLRLQPYIQLPLKEAGIGKIMLTSAGLHATYIFRRKK